MATEIYSSSAITETDMEAFGRLSHGAIVDLPHKLIHEAFGKVAAVHPSVIAVEYDGDQMTYKELDLASTRLSRHLLHLGLCPLDRVVLLAQRSFPMIVAILAVLKSGCQYVPIDGGVVSDANLAHILSDLSPSFVLALSRYTPKAQRLAITGTQILTLEDSWNGLDNCDIDNGFDVSINPDDGAYIIYTSGSYYLV